MNRFVPTVSLFMLAGCTMGPNYNGPPTLAHSPSHFVRSDDNEAEATPVVAKWWLVFRDPVLDSLEAKALRGNPNADVARARLVQARAGMSLEKANGLPKAGTSTLYLHGDLPPTSLGAIGSGSAQGGGSGRTTLDYYNLGFDASWEVDLFGSNRRSIEAASANEAAAKARVADTIVSLTAELAQDYINLRERQQRIDLSRQDLVLAQQIEASQNLRLSGGTVTQMEVVQAQQQVEHAASVLSTLEGERDLYLNALAVLTGQAPGALDDELMQVRPVPHPPALVAVTDPASMLSRRPDVRAAERTLASQTAKVGVAKAAMFPKVSFMGVLGMGGSAVLDVFDPTNLSALAIPRLQWSFLDFGRNASRLRQAKGIRDEAEAQYRSSVLTALQDAENSLARFGARRSALSHAMADEKLALKGSQIVAGKKAAGTARLTDEFDARRRLISAQLTVVQATAAVSGDFVSLEKSLGLGWEEGDLTPTKGKADVHS